MLDSRNMWQMILAMSCPHSWIAQVGQLQWLINPSDHCPLYGPVIYVCDCVSMCVSVYAYMCKSEHTSRAVSDPPINLNYFSTHMRWVLSRRALQSISVLPWLKTNEDICSSYSTFTWHSWQGIFIFCLIMCWTFKWVTIAFHWLCISRKTCGNFNSLKTSQTVIFLFAFFGFIDPMWKLVWRNNCWCAIVMKKLWNPTQAGKHS